MRKAIWTFGLGISALSLALQGCLVGTGKPMVQAEGISLSNPKAGQMDTYVHYHYGTLGSPASDKTYDNYTLSLWIDSVSADSIFLGFKQCFEDCSEGRAAVSRSTGKTSESIYSNIFTGVNIFPKGILSEDFSNEIAFQAYHPDVQQPEVGYKKSHALKAGSFADVIVLVDPTDIPVDGGGLVLLLTKDRRILEIYHYAVFGIDSGFELAETPMPVD